LANTFKPHQDIFPNPDHLTQINTFLFPALPMFLPRKPIFPYKATGHDLITNKVLKNLQKMYHLINTYLQPNFIVILIYLHLETFVEIIILDKHLTWALTTTTKKNQY